MNQRLGVIFSQVFLGSIGPSSAQAGPSSIARCLHTSRVLLNSKRSGGGARRGKRTSSRNDAAARPERKSFSSRGDSIRTGVRSSTKSLNGGARSRNDVRRSMDRRPAEINKSERRSSRKLPSASEFQPSTKNGDAKSRRNDFRRSSDRRSDEFSKFERRSSRKLPSASELQPSTKKMAPSKLKHESVSSQALLGSEFDLSPPNHSNAPSSSDFTSPPLLPGLLRSVKAILGDDARPTAIQAFAMQSMIPLNKRIAKGKDTVKRQWGYFLLASETGSGKSFAYLLPVLQHLKETEAKLGETPQPELPAPRAIVLAPTHELSRQLARFAKSLIHHEKLRVVCASRANTESSLNVGQVKFEGEPAEGEEASRHQRQVDVLTSTPGRLLDLALGSSWNKANGGADMKDGMENNKAITVGEPRISLERVECVVVDEADILFDQNFLYSTMQILSSIASARSALTSSPSYLPGASPLPYHLILSTATIPSSLSSLLSTHPTFHGPPAQPSSNPSSSPQFPPTSIDSAVTFTRLLSPNLHRLPSTLRTEHLSWAGGNRGVSVSRKIKEIWAGEEALRRVRPDITSGADSNMDKSKILIFTNRSSRALSLGYELTAQGIPNVTLTSTSSTRKNAYGSNRHIDTFLRHPEKRDKVEDLQSAAIRDKDQIHVLITTSLLSRGIDFHPSVRHVFIVDPPRNMVDFIHRAGRTARAGMEGKIVIFGKKKGRGSAEGDRVKQRLKALTMK